MEIFNLSGYFLCNFVVAFILLVKNLTLVSGQFLVIGPEKPIQTSMGGEVELLCYLSPPQSAENMEVAWLQSTRLVHLYRDGEDLFDDQDPDYQGRTELVKDGITNGNVILKIRAVRLLDAGRYRCLFDDDSFQEEADMELKVLGEENMSQMLPPTYYFILGSFGFILVVIFLSYVLSFQVYFHRSRPWMGEISGLLVLTFTLEIELSIFFLWIRHRCRGILFDETSLWKDWKFWGSIVFLVVIDIIPIYFLLKYFFQQRFHQSTQPLPGPDYKVISK
ncbi:myelin-oligodendrocyte glycoprotein-like [Macrotis lagotis]|uniref:myelin-oligodendrocyte glycoprotein-like n=1 Tax=Macrotis lagotis TaxID=92651 RepID=UPI003D69C8C1